MNKTIRSGSREVIYNYKVFMRCLAQFQAGKLITDLKGVYKRTADMTGKSEKEYYELGQTMYNNIDELIINVGVDSSSESETESEAKHFTPLPSTSRQEPETMSGVEYLDFDLLEDD